MLICFLLCLIPHGPADIAEIMLRLPYSLADFPGGLVHVRLHLFQVEIPVEEPAQEPAEKQALAEGTAASAKKVTKQQNSQPGRHFTSPFIRESPGMRKGYCEDRKENRTGSGK